MGIYGVYGTHTTEGCPLYNKENRRLLLRIAETFADKASQYNVKFKEQYHSGLEHTFLWVAEAENAHSIQDLLIETEVAKFNALKIVPLRTLQNVVNYCKQVEHEGSKRT
jgi:hypothetical protein